VPPGTLGDVDVLERVEQDFIARRDSGALAGAFPGWRAKHEGLRRFTGIDALIAACRDEKDRSWEDADAALSALSEEGASGDECASILLLWLLLPGLLLARARLAASGAISLEELTSEMLTGLWEEAVEVPRSSERVAARLVNSARFRALAAVRKAIDWTGRAEPLPDDPAGWTLLADQGPDTEPDDLSDAVREGVLSQAEVELLLARRERFRETCKQLGIPDRVAGMRRFRARARLREWAARTYRFPTRD